MLSVSHLKNKRWSMRIWNGCTIHFSKMWHEIQTAAVTKSFKWSFLLIKWLQISPEISIYPKTSGRWTLCHIAPLLKEDCNPLKNCVKIQCVHRRPKSENLALFQNCLGVTDLPRASNCSLWILSEANMILNLEAFLAASSLSSVYSYSKCTIGQ